MTSNNTSNYGVFKRIFTDLQQLGKVFPCQNSLNMLSIYHIVPKLSYEINHKFIDKNVTPLYLTYTLFLML